jgi:hypothetical protein
MTYTQSNVETNIDEPTVTASGEGYLTFFKRSVLLTLTAAVLEVSRSTLLLEVDEAIESGGKVELGLRRLTVHGEVRTCRVIEPGRYRLSVLIHQVLDPVVA